MWSDALVIILADGSVSGTVSGLGEEAGKDNLWRGKGRLENAAFV
jgi:hypothetical protein